MKRPRPLLLFLVIVAATTAIWESSATARKKVVVLGFSGRGGSQVRSGFLRGLRGKASVISPRKFARTAKRLRVSGRSAAGRAAVCSKLRCSAVIKGAVKKRGRRHYRVSVTVYNGADGSVIGSRSGTARGRRRLGGTGRSLARGSLALIGQGSFSRKVAAARNPEPEPAPQPEPQPQPQPEPQPQAKAPPVEDELFTTKRRKKREEKEEEEDDDDDDHRGGQRPGGLDGLFGISVAVGMSTRSYELAGSNPDDNSIYDGGMFPEVTARLEFYPLVLATTGFLRNIGIGAAFTHHISVSTKLPADESKVGTGSLELLLDLRLRYNLFDKPTLPTVFVFGGFGMRNFDLDAKSDSGLDNTVLTSFNYKFIRAGLDVVAPIGSPLLGVYAGFDVRPLLGVGQDAVNAYGKTTGGFSWAVRGGVQGSLPFGLYYFATFEYLAFSSDFEGLGTSAEANTIDRSEATSGSDKYIRIWAGAGYAM